MLACVDSRDIDGRHKLTGATPSALPTDDYASSLPDASLRWGLFEARPPVWLLEAYQRGAYGY